MGIHWDRLDERLRAQVEANAARYERVRPALATVTSQLQSGIRDIFSNAELTPLFVTARTKSVESFRDKASRMLQPAEPGGAPALEFPDPLREIHDLVGVRVIVSLPHEIREAAALIKRQRSDFDCRADREKDIGSIESGTYGYASRHLILRTLQNNTVKAYQQALGEPARATGSYLFEVPDPHDPFATPGRRLEHDIRFKSSDPRAWSPYFDRQFTATAAMLEAVESAFAELHERYEDRHRLLGRRGRRCGAADARRVREVWQTLLPHVDRKSDDDWGWAAELLAAHGLKTTTELAALLNPETITDVRAALEHRYSPGPDRLLDDLLLWRFGRSHIELTAGEDDHRRESLQRRFRQLETYRLGM